MRVSIKTGGSLASPKVGGGNRPPANAGSAPASAPSDALSVSNSAHFIQEAQAAIADIPDVRTEKVEALRAQLDAQTYDPDPEAVADGLVREHTPTRLDA